MKIYFLRHAESEQNARHEFQSDAVGLSPRGKGQLADIAAFLDKEPISKIYGSTMVRAKETVGMLSDKKGITPIYSDLLIEVRWPSELEGLPTLSEKGEAVRAKISEMYHLGNWKYSDEETYDELKARAKKFITEEIQKGTEGETWLVVTHGDILKMIIALLIFGDALTPQFFQKFKRQFKIYHGAFATCEFVGGLWVLSSWDSRSHLSETNKE